MKAEWAVGLAWAIGLSASAETIRFSPVADKPWSLAVEYETTGGKMVRRELAVTPIVPSAVTSERYDKLPLFDAKKAGWVRGVRLKSLMAYECSICDALIPSSVRVDDEHGKAYRSGIDYQLEPRWGTVGRLPGGAIGDATPVWISYRYYPLRLDSVVLTASGELTQKIGVVKGATPLPPQLAPGERRLGNIYFERNTSGLTDGMLFPLENQVLSKPTLNAASCLSKTLVKLRNGEKVRILAWGDSVTHMGYLPESQRWINGFVAGLRQRFPKANIELVNLGWPGKRAATFFNRPSGDRYNYEEKVVASGADLVTIEFVNDAGIKADDFEKVYGRVARDFKKAGMEVIVLTPHYTRPDWMGLKSQKHIDNDPRLYTTLLRQWAKKNNFALADVSARYGQVWRDGIPYNTFMTNAINHPDARGARLFVETLLALFPEK